jgi:hypothetical protein
MSDNIPPATPPAEPPASAAPGGSGSSPFKVFETEEQYKAALNRKLGNYAPKSEIEKLTGLLAAKNTEIQDWQKKVTGLESELSDFRLGSLRQKVGREAGLPPEWIEDIKGIDEASMKADAERLRKKLGIKRNIGDPVPPGQHGVPQSENDDMNGLLLSMARGGFTGR